MLLLALFLEMAVVAPAETPACKRSDFDTFDAFVDCQVSETATPAPPRPRPSREEVAPGLVPKGPDRLPLSELRAAKDRADRVVIGTAIPAAVFGVGGLVAMLVGSTMTEHTGDDGGPQCTVGKRCGNTCIEVADTCSVGGSSEPLTREGRATFIAGTVALTVGVGLLFTAVLFKFRSNNLEIEIGRVRF